MKDQKTRPGAFHANNDSERIARIPFARVRIGC
jgi:hypothetical protein